MLVRDNYNFYFNKDMCIIYFRNKVVAHIFLIDDLYHLHVDASVNINEQTVDLKSIKNSFDGPIKGR